MPEADEEEISISSSSPAWWRVCSVSQEGEERTTEGIGKTMSNYALPSGGSNLGGNQAQGTTNQEGTGSNVLSAIGETVTNVGENVKKPFENMTSSGNKQISRQVQGRENEGMTKNIGEKLGDAAESMKKPLGNITEGGSKVLRAVTETVGDIGNSMIKPAEKVRDGQGGGGDIG